MSNGSEILRYKPYSVLNGTVLVVLALGSGLAALWLAARVLMWTGPGLAGVGSIRHYGGMPEIGKWILSMCMLKGRLEILTVVALLSPYTWRK